MITLLKIYLLVRSKGLGIGLETVIGQKIMVDKIRFHLLSLFCYGNTLTEKKKTFSAQSAIQTLRITQAKLCEDYVGCLLGSRHDFTNNYDYESGNW